MLLKFQLEVASHSLFLLVISNIQKIPNSIVEQQASNIFLFFVPPRVSYQVLEWCLVSAWATGIMRFPATGSKCDNMLSNLQVHVINSGMSLKFQVARQIQQVDRGVKQLGISFGSIFLLFSYEGSCQQTHS